MCKNLLLFIFLPVILFLSGCEEEAKEPNTYDFRKDYVGDFKMTIYTAHHRGNVNTVFDTYSFDGAVHLYDPADSLKDLSDEQHMEFFDDPRISIAFAPDTLISPALSSNGKLQGISRAAYLQGGFITQDSLVFQLRFEEPNFWAKEFSVVGVRK